MKPRRPRNAKLLREIKSRPCSICGSRFQVDPSHIRSRGAGGPDTEWNVVPKCRLCHIDWGTYGALRFCQQHPHFALTIEKLGWYFEGPKLRHPELEAQDPANKIALAEQGDTATQSENKKREIV